MHTENTDITHILIERARSGHQQSIYKLYKMYVQAMYNICVRLVSSRIDAEDILQESFISAFGNLVAFKGESSFGVWLKRIVINNSVNHLKKRKQWFSDIDELQVFAQNIPDTDEDTPGEDILEKISVEVERNG